MTDGLTNCEAILEKSGRVFFPQAHTCYGMILSAGELFCLHRAMSKPVWGQQGARLNL